DPGSARLSLLQRLLRRSDERSGQDVGQGQGTQRQGGCGEVILGASEGPAQRVTALRALQLFCVLRGAESRLVCQTAANPENSSSQPLKCLKVRTHSSKRNPMQETLSAESLRKINAYWRAANYLSVGQIYLLDNPLL